MAEFSFRRNKIASRSKEKIKKKLWRCVNELNEVRVKRFRV